MKSSFSLLNDLENKPTPTKYQVFEAEVGFEKARVTIPFVRADEFQAEALKAKPKSISSLSKIASKYGGVAE